MIPYDVLNVAAKRAGLDLVAAVPVDADLSEAATTYTNWLTNGYAGDMAYLQRPDAIAKRADPRLILPDAKTVIVAASSYYQRPSPTVLPDLYGRVAAMYAWGEDYHRWLLKRMQQLIRNLETSAGKAISAKCYVDTGPVMERAWALLGGLGWIGKNACLINPCLGSWLFLAVALVDVEIEPAAPDATMPGCGSCTRCLDTCPTGALVAPGVVDARKCLSYLTIENRGAIPVQYRQAMGTSVFGCDMCQQVCPWNDHAGTGAVIVSTEHQSLDLVDAMFIDQDTFRQRYRHSPIWRAKPEGLARNAAVVLGNLGDKQAIPHLQRAVAEHPSALVVEHARWALEQFS